MLALPHWDQETFPLNIACKFKIPLLIFMESPLKILVKPYNGGLDFSIDYFCQMSAKVKPEEMLCEYISERFSTF